MHDVEVYGDLRVDESLVSPCHALVDVAFHLLIANPAELAQGLVAVQYHNVNLLEDVQQMLNSGTKNGQMNASVESPLTICVWKSGEVHMSWVGKLDWLWVPQLYVALPRPYSRRRRGPRPGS